MATNINNRRPVINLDLVTFVREFIPVQASEYTLFRESRGNVKLSAITQLQMK